MLVFANGMSLAGGGSYPGASDAACGVVLHAPKLGYRCGVDLLKSFTFSGTAESLGVSVSGSTVNLTQSGNQYQTMTALVRAWGIKF